jgi:trehalose 6-phosphate synthase/phosphatase
VSRLLPDPALEAARERLRAAAFLVLLLDYDGTLVPFADTPDLGAPDIGVLSLLNRLARRARTETHVVSGRPWQPLGKWLDVLPVWLHAEHGGWSRTPDGAWTAVPLPALEWREPARRILTDFVACTPGALVEEKTYGLVWHYRMADAAHGLAQASALKRHLAAALDGAPMEILDGAKVVELRPQGHHKGRVVPPILGRVPRGSVLAALGDDRTDEDLFAALPPGAVAIHVGEAASRAGLRLPSVAAARACLEAGAATP